MAVADPYDRGPAYEWKLSMSFATAAARLKGLVKGTLPRHRSAHAGGLAEDRRAEVLGSRGADPVSGPELAGRLGLDSTWAYFSVKSGTSSRREPDHSGRPPAGRAPANASPPTACDPGGTAGRRAGAGRGRIDRHRRRGRHERTLRHVSIPGPSAPRGLMQGASAAE